MRERLVLTCEHGGKRVPREHAPLFRGTRAAEALRSHRGWDPGALALARGLARRTGAPLLAETVTRLLVEANRSLGHPRLFSEFTRDLPRDVCHSIILRYWRPHRDAVRTAVAREVAAGRRVVHVGVHSFTPVLDGEVRTMDVGLLYDPARPLERRFCARWREALLARAPHLRVRRNAPYRGVSDALVTALRREFPPARYLGLELEVNQALLLGPRPPRARALQALADSLPPSEP